MNINKLIKECHQNAIDKGFYACPDCLNGYIKIKGDPYFGEPEEMEEPRKCETCNGTGINNNRNIGELLMLIVSELSEALEAHRNNKRAYWNKHINDLLLNGDKVLYETHIKGTFEEEIADTFIRLFDLCGYLNIDIEKHITAKMEYNKTRPYKHNKEY